MSTVYLAGGCFWGVEEFFQRTEGIVSTRVGYINSAVEAPSYEAVCTGRTRAAEGVKIDFDPQYIQRKDILNLFYRIINPFFLNRQGNDIGTQYRTGLYYTSEEERDCYEQFLMKKQAHEVQRIKVEVEPLKNFYEAEEYHQRYLKKNPGGYCHIELPTKK
ncbi:MAG: peptide-methionine (S)-S-oxide reductase MsrA [Tissierellia bacterium]|nr:peptide-methionine (S)-S-oxide reductase MsrA [Tissierellia bacterium]